MISGKADIHRDNGIGACGFPHRCASKWGGSEEGAGTVLKRVQRDSIRNGRGDLQNKSTPEGFNHFGGPIKRLTITEVGTYCGGAGTNFLGFETYHAFLQEISLHLTNYIQRYLLKK